MTIYFRTPIALNANISWKRPGEAYAPNMSQDYVLTLSSTALQTTPSTLEEDLDIQKFFKNWILRRIEN